MKQVIIKAIIHQQCRKEGIKISSKPAVLPEETSNKEEFLSTQ
jgi:hypothetical protein